MSQDSPLVNIRDAARRCGVPKNWLKRQVVSGHLPAIVIGRRQFFDIAELRAALAEMAAKSRATASGEEASNAS